MDKIKIGLFDIFVYILPGAIILISLDLIKNPHVYYAEYIFNCSKNYTIFQVAILLSVSYVIGFLNQYFSYEVFKILAPNIWKNRFTGKETSIGKLEAKIVMIRHFSPENFSTLNTWLVFRSMCYSLFVATILLFFTVLVRAIQSNCFNEQCLDLFVIGFSSFLFLRRSVTFHEWIHGTIDHSSAKMNEFSR
ncbi:hypothetical protein [Flavobacterium granuli]|uniref:RDD family protein n=1 Tax=Flavobacterium granuli TaxID=280093 RepID=A0ABU1S3H8_9FLAO|nr:hypothetical protein [Flavobacterium granuli]MDR6845594.1 hypothetical protein [Flavobacterium granuli]